MKDLEEIKEILRIQRAVEAELKTAILGKIPEISDFLVTALFDLIEKEGKDLRITLTPCIVLNYIDSKAYIRILPLNAGPLMSTTYERGKLYPSYELYKLFDLKEYELHSLQLRKELCKALSKGVQEHFRSLGCKSSIRCGVNNDGYTTENIEYIVIPKI